MSILVRWKNELTWTMFTYQSFKLGYIFIYTFLQSLYIKGKYSLISCEDAWLGHVFKPKHAPECQMRSVLRNPALQCGVSFMRIHAGSCEAMHSFFFLKRTRKDQILARSTDCSSFTGARQVPRGAWKKQNLASERSALRFGTWMHHTLLCVCERLS